MRRIRIFTAAMAFSTSLAASSALAQGAPPGYQICWGPPGQVICSSAAVPLDPWMLVALSALLAIVLVWVQRRHSGFGAYLVAGVLALAAAVSYQIREVWATTVISLDTSSGVKTQYCLTTTQPTSTQIVDGSNYLTVQNDTSNTLGLVITPLNGADLSWPVPPSTCKTTLASGATCNLPCSSQPQPD